MKNPPQKILVISGIFPPTRIAEADHVILVCRRLAKRGFQVCVLTNRDAATAAEDDEIQVFPIMKNWNWFELPRLLRTARKSEPDAVLFWYLGHGYRFHPMATLIPTLLKRVIPKSTVVTQFSFPEPSRPWLQSIFTRAFWRLLISTSGSKKIDYRYGALLNDSDYVIAMAETHLTALSVIQPLVVAKATVIPPPH